MDLFIELVEESVFRAHAEIAHCEEAQLFEYKLASQLNLDRRAAHEVLQRQGRYLHDVANIETVDPFVLVEVAEDIFHVGVAHFEFQATSESPTALLLALFHLLCLCEHRIEGEFSSDDGPRHRYSSFFRRLVIFNSHSLQQQLKDGQQLYRSFLQQRVMHVADDADFLERLFLRELLRKVSAKVF